MIFTTALMSKSSYESKINPKLLIWSWSTSPGKMDLGEPKIKT